MKPTKISQLTIPDNYSLEETGLTQSLAHMFSECPRKFLLAINRWRSKKGQDKFAVGNIVHDVLSVVYKEIPTKPYINGFVAREIGRYYKNNPLKFQYIEKQQLEVFKTIAYCLLIKYIEYYKDDFKMAKFTNTEREFSKLINGILWRGKIDGEHTVKKDKSLWVLETKTKSRINDETIQKSLSMDFQGRLYCNIKERESKQNISGFIYNVIRIPGIKPHKQETIMQFSQRLQDDIDERPEYYFMRWEVPLTVEDKNSFLFDLNTIEDNIKDYLGYKINFKKISDIKNCFSCTGGISPCQYLDACIQGHTGGYYQSETIFDELDCGL